MVLVFLQQWLHLVMIRAVRCRISKMVIRGRAHSVRIKDHSIRVDRIVHSRRETVTTDNHIASKCHDSHSTAMISAGAMQHPKAIVVISTVLMTGVPVA